MNKTKGTAKSGLAEVPPSAESDRERAFLATCQQLYRRENGCTTPFEHLIWELVTYVEAGVMPTPKMVEEEVKSFRENWEDMRDKAKSFVDAYEKSEAPAPTEPPRAKVDPEWKEPRLYYQLTKVEEGEVGDAANITRAEFYALKKHLVAMRARKTRRGKAA